MNDLRKLVRYYDLRYSAPPGAMRDYRLYLDMVSAEPGEHLLDVGCGEGFLLDAAEKAGMRATGVEITERALSLARRTASGAQLVCAAGEALPFPARSFHIVSCIGTLEHFADPSAGAAEVSRVLRPAGRALIVVPNRRFMAWWLQRHRGTEQQEVSELLLGLGEWRDLLRAGGLEVLRVVKEPWHTKPSPSLLRRSAIRFAWRILPLRWTYQFACICRKA